MRIVLASKSPRRAELIKLLGWDYIIKSADVDETYILGTAFDTYAKESAEKKARATECSEGDIVLGVDTIVVSSGRLYTKPKDKKDAYEMLSSYSGNVHEVISGVCLRSVSKASVFIVVSKVYFSRLTHSEIEDYVASDEPYDKAGGYAVQGKGAKFIERIEGCFYNVMGLPISAIYQCLKREF